MIISFKCKKTESIFNGDQVVSSFLPVKLQEQAFEVLFYLDAAKIIQDFWLLPSLKLKRVQGTKKSKNIYEVRINNRYRIYFDWVEPNAVNVYIGDHL